ncbi:MAG: DUF4091 domain-containing protein, partial [Bacteroidota bacterium]
YGAIDFWALTGQSGSKSPSGISYGYIIKTANERRKLGEKTAMYNGTRPSFGVPAIIDVDAADARVNPWIAWRYKVDLYFLWYSNLYVEKNNKDSTIRHMNPWVDNYLPYSTGYAWGNGTFIYPGEDKEYPAFDHGLQGPIASIRMKNWRRGQQDYEYLWLVRQAGFGSSADSVVRSVVPFAFDECPDGQNAPPPWAVRGYMYEHQRQYLAMMLDSIQKKTSKRK